MLNGRFPGDSCGSFTCFKENGCSLVDYMLCSTSLFIDIVEFTVHTRDGSDHFPLSVTISCPVKPVGDRDDDGRSYNIPRFYWKE